MRRNTASILVEGKHRLPFEARTGRGLAAPENPPTSAVGSTVSACGEDGSGRMLCVSGETSLCEAGIQRQDMFHA